MAEHAAHVTSQGSLDPNRPTIFEVLAQQNLWSTLRPALRHAIRVFAERYPSQLSRFVQFYDEIYLVVDTVINSYYLKTWNGSFAENFYDLKRVPADMMDVPLPFKLRLRVTACLVLIPYIKAKLDSLFEDLQYTHGTDTTLLSFFQKDLNTKQRLLRLFLVSYPYIHSAWETACVVYSASYLLGRGAYHCPSVHLSGTKLTRLDPTENSGASEGIFSDDVFDWYQSSLTRKMIAAVKSVLKLLGICLSTTLSCGVFFLQFLEWWYASDSNAPSLTALPTPHPPKQEQLEGIHHQTCPLCMRHRTNSTALSVSGYVFCYPCIIEHVRKEKCCPITGYPATTEHLVKIYEQDL